MQYKIYVVDDDKHYSRMLSYRLEKNVDYDVHVFSRGEELLENMSEPPDVVLLDIMMPGIGGLETLKRIKESHPNLPIIMVSAQGVIDVAVEAMQAGAYDYITKGQDEMVKLDAVVKNVLEKVTLEREITALRGEVKKRYSISGLVGESEAMQEVYKTIEKTLRGDLTVVVQGESGTGKELVAKAIHYNSARKKGPFVVVNCAAIPRELMESEFFGHEKGSFTGAHARKIGKFEQSDGGTIFLDEIGELDLELQAKLLRALQSFEITRVGGNELITFDSRVISATHRDIPAMIREGKFREDLYYRLFQFPISLPPLRDRGQDVIRLSSYFLKDYIKDHPEFKGKKLSSGARRAILDYSWPGNVRELKSAVERSILIADGEEIQADDLMLFDRVQISPWAERVAMARTGEGSVARMQPDRPAVSKGADSSVDRATGIVLGTGEEEILSLDDLKRQAIERAYKLCEGNVDRAAVELGIGRATMYRLLKKYHLMQ